MSRDKNMTTKTIVRERPVTFSAPMIRAFLDGSKTHARFPLHPQPEHVWGWGVKHGEHDFTAHVRYPGCHPPDPWIRCPYGAPPHRGEVGSRLWVREALYERASQWFYKADDAPVLLAPEYRAAAVSWAHHKESESCPAAHMPRWASRITLEITGVRVERLQDITEEEAQAEGVAAWAAAYCSRLPEDELYARAYFDLMWNHDNGKRHPWSSNPFCWSLSFRLLAPTRGREG